MIEAAGGPQTRIITRHSEVPGKVASTGDRGGRAETGQEARGGQRSSQAGANCKAVARKCYAGSNPAPTTR